MDAGFGANVRDRAGDGGFGAGPRLGAQDAQVPGRLVPLNNKPGMRARPSREARIATKVFLRQVQTLRCGVHAGPSQTIPEFAKSEQEPERHI